MYADDYWTGFYTSRANNKAYIRRGGSYLQAGSKLLSENMMNATGTSEDLKGAYTAQDRLMDEMGINQNHDAVTGTERQPVADDYSRRIADGMRNMSAEYRKRISNAADQQMGA